MIHPTLKLLLTSVLIQIFSFTVESNAQDASATIYFYRPRKSGSSLRYDLKEGETVIHAMKPGSVTVYHCKPGPHEFYGEVNTSSSIRMNAEPSKVYFIWCGAATTPTRRATFRLATRGEARLAIRKIDKIVAVQIPPSVITTSADTVRALQHMFRRRRVAGTIGLVTGIVVTPIIAAAAINYEPKVLAPGITVDDQGRYVAGAFNGVALTIWGIAMRTISRPVKLEAMLEDAGDGKPLPPRYLKHLKKKDFR